MTWPEDLRGEARSRFETWRTLGLSEAAAVAQVRADGLLPAADGFDTLTESFRSMGLSEGAARTAAVGRGGSEFEARRSARAAEGRSVSERQRWQDEVTEIRGQMHELREALAMLSDEELRAPSRRPGPVTLYERGSARRPGR